MTLVIMSITLKMASLGITYFPFKWGKELS